MSNIRPRNECIMELECLKFNEKMPAENAECRHPDDYCKYRTSCIIFFMEKEKKREGKAETDKGNKRIAGNTQKK